MNIMLLVTFYAMLLSAFDPNFQSRLLHSSTDRSIYDPNVTPTEDHDDANE